MAVMLDIRPDASQKEQIRHLRDQLEMYLNGLEQKVDNLLNNPQIVGDVSVERDMNAGGIISSNKSIVSYYGSASSVPGGFPVDRLVINTCGLTEHTNLTSTSAYTLMPLKNESGSNQWLTTSTSGVTINGKCYVMVWGYFYISGTTDNDAIYIAPHRNGTVMHNLYERMPGGNTSVIVPPVWFSCNAGDVITIGIRNATAVRGQVQASSFSRFLVRVVSPI